jgi:CBS domain-containing protein
MNCEEVMKKDIQYIKPHNTAQEAARQMRASNVGFLPVCEDDLRVLGVVTDRDLALRVLAEGLPSNIPVEQVMTHEVVACNVDDDLNWARELMGVQQKSRMMVLDDDGCLAGVISLSDIAALASKEQAAETLRQVSEREAHP